MSHLGNSYGETEGLLSAVMDSCRDAIIAHGFDGRVEAWNRGAEDIYGYSTDEAIGACRLGVPDEQAEEAAWLAEESQAGRSTPPFETVRQRKNGETFPASVCAFPIRSADDQVIGYATIERDISDRVSTADALREALSEAQKANSAKSMFLANASHELRTPMHAIAGMTQLALEEELTPELRDYLETIRDSSDAMLQLVNDMLDLTRFESRQFDLDEIRFDLRELVEATAKALGPAAHSKGLELVCRVAPETPAAVVSDPMRLRQVLTNLVGNAIKFTASGEVVIEVEPISIDANRSKIAFRVSDTGIGISPDDQQRIFAPFTQVDEAVTRRYSGSGLGLTISRYLLHRFESDLAVDSTPGEGSCFSFDLVVLAADSTKETWQRSAERAATDHLEGLSVLVVDDNEASRRTLVDQLTAWGMRVDAESSGAAAAERVEQQANRGAPFDLAVIDALMPGADGFSVARQIDSNPNVTTKPILMASTMDRLEFSRRCVAAGAAGFIQKPISQSQLLSAVAQATGVATVVGPEPRRGLFETPASTPLQVLLVEDTAANRKVVRRALKKRGHQLDQAMNGREAIDAYRNHDYDLILMDVQMPIMDGYQATEAIREIERGAGRSNGATSHTPIIAMTAHTMSGDRERCLRAGMDGYLPKPIDLTQLIETIESAPAADKEGRSNHRKASDDTVSARAKDSQTKEQSMPGTTTAVNANTIDFVDLDNAIDRLRGDRSLLIDMMEFYLEDVPRLVATIGESWQTESLPELKRAAHSLKGLAATFDAHPTVAAARNVEVAADDGDKVALPSLIDQLKIEHDRLFDFLSDYPK